jgi:molybdate transport system substrate-binding protein
MTPYRYLILCGLLWILCLFSHRLLADEVNVAVAANFIDACRQLAPLFEQVSGHQVKLSYGSTGKLYAQIANGAPFAVFLAADTQHPRMAERVGLTVPGSRFIYAKGRLVLWSAKAGLFEVGEPYLKSAAFAHLAIANPKTAPYGRAAQQVMQHLGVWSALQSRVVRGDSISQAFQFVATGNAEAGFVAYSQVQAWRGDSGSIWVIPQAYYAPIAQAAVLLNNGAANPAAKAFLEFLKGDTARQVIESHGYGVD